MRLSRMTFLHDAPRPIVPVLRNDHWLVICRTYIVYRNPATGTRSHGSRTGSRYDWLKCGTPTEPLAPSPVGVKNQNGVDVRTISNLAIGFPVFFWN